MSSDPLISSFDTMRPWQGQVSRSFEELSYQLLKAEVPDGTRAIRTGNPDGGVEWYATRPDGTEWGWQAKHVHDFGDLLGAMTASVRAVVRDRPALTKLTFVISSNLTTGTQGGRVTSQRQKYEAKVESWKKNIPGADKLDFELVQESDLLERLSLPANRGPEVVLVEHTVAHTRVVRPTPGPADRGRRPSLPPRSPSRPADRGRPSIPRR